MLRVAEVLLERGPDLPVLLALERFVALASDADLVPGEQARHALVDEAEQMIAQHRLRS